MSSTFCELLIAAVIYFLENAVADVLSLLLENDWLIQPLFIIYWAITMS